jgi:hypothetical protein
MNTFQVFFIFIFWGIVIFWIFSEKSNKGKKKFSKCPACGANKVVVHAVYMGRDFSCDGIEHYCHHSVCKKCEVEEKKDENKA